MKGDPTFEENPIASLQRALERIDTLDGRLQAWVEFDREGALRVAQQLGNAEPSGLPLLGTIVGVKDIIDVAGLSTRLGTRPFAHFEPASDATAVARLRAAGAVILGKTATTEFAHRDAAPTRNPWHLEHTPGGSSSGSGAAVGADMIGLALGTQTIGSTLRPAAFCGCVGFKGTHGRISTRGIFPLAPSFDHVGILCRSVSDAAIAFKSLAWFDSQDPFSIEVPLEDFTTVAFAYSGPPRLALARAEYASGASEEVANHLDAVAERCRDAGASVIEVRLPASAQSILDTGYPIFRAEAATVHKELFSAHAGEYGPNIRSLIEAGQVVVAADYASRRFDLLRLRRQFVSLLEAYDALLLPTAPTVAPRGLDQTGSAVYCAPASFMGLPAISLPSGVSEAGLPFAVQLVSRPLREAALLGVASWVERVLAFQDKPGFM